MGRKKEGRRVSGDQEADIVQDPISPEQARRRFEEGAGGEESDQARPRAPSRGSVGEARERYLEQAASPTPGSKSKAGKDRMSLKKRKRFGRRRRKSSSSSSSSSDSSHSGGSSSEDDVPWDELIDSRYTPLIIDLADWLGYVTGRKVSWEKFFDKIWSGVLLCEFCNSMNKICNDATLPQINLAQHRDKGKTFIRYNVEVFIIWCRAFGVPDLSLMTVSDLVDKKSVKMVLGTVLAVGREARARALPCPVVAVLEQTYRMNYDTMIDAVVEDEAIEDSKTIQDSIRLKKKRFQMIKSKAQTGSALNEGVDASSRNIQEDILCLMFHKGFKRGKDDVAESVIKGWQGAVRSDFKSATLPSKLRGPTAGDDPLRGGLGLTLPRNYGGTRSPTEEEPFDEVAAAEELRNFKTPDLPKESDRKISFGFGLFDRKTPTPPPREPTPPPATPEPEKSPAAAEYILTIPGEQFQQMRESGVLGSMLDSYERTEAGEYNVVLTGEQYADFQRIMNADRIEAASERDEADKKGKKKKKDKKKDKKDTDGENSAAGGNTPKQKRKTSRLGRWGSRSSVNKAETSESEGEKKRTKRFSFTGRNKSKGNTGTSASEDGEKKKRSSVFGRKKKSSAVPPVQPKQETQDHQQGPQDHKQGPQDYKKGPQDQHLELDLDPNAGVVVELGEQQPLEERVETKNYHSIDRRTGSMEQPREKAQTWIPPHLDYSDQAKRSSLRPEPEVLKPDYKTASEQRYGSEGQLNKDYASSGDVSDASVYSVVSYPVIGKRKRKKKKIKRGPGAGTYSSEVGCLECFIMVFCPWRWVSGGVRRY